MNKFATFILLSILTIVSSNSCKKNKDPESQLPPATQEGRDTFGCLVDGNVFKPKGSPFGGPILSCAYQFIDGGYYFQLAAKNSGDIFRGVSIHTDSLQISEGNTYKLEDFYKKGGASARYSVAENLDLIEYLTTTAVLGELKISKLDTINRIVSGTFWFDAVNSDSHVVKVRDGRFDVRYSL